MNTSKLLNLLLILSATTLTIVGSAFAHAAQQTEQLSATNKSNLTVPQLKIIGGQNAVKGEFRFITALTSSSGSGIDPFCGASFIGSRYVLTAAHCVENTLASSIDVWIGGHDTTLPNEGQRVSVAQIYSHEQYDSLTINKDIAILELSQEVTGIEPVKLMTADIEATINEGDLYTILGWGALSADAQTTTFPEILQVTQVPQYNRADCEAIYTEQGSTQTELTEFMLCAGFVEGGKDTCQGDSGGPLVFEYNGESYVSGVVSFGYGCAQANSPGIYSRVSKFDDWIAEKTSGLSYTQTNNLGAVENDYAGSNVFSIKNNSDTAFSVTDVAITENNNFSGVSITSNTCDGATLNNNETCDITVSASVDGIGSGGYTLAAQTNNPVSATAQIFFEVNALEPVTQDYSDVLNTNSSLIQLFDGGDANWEPQTAVTADGISALASGDILDDQSSQLLAVIDSPRAEQLRFKAAVSSEQDFDFLRVYNNQQLTNRFSGQNSDTFTDVAVDLVQGVNRVLISYEKDFSVSEGNDKAYIDNLTLQVTNAAPVTRLASSVINVQENAQFTLDASASSDPDNDEISFSWQLIGSSALSIPSPNAATTTLTAPSANTASTLTFRVTVTDSFNASSNGNVRVNINSANNNQGDTTESSGGSMGAILMLLALSCGLFRRSKVGE